MLGWVSLHAQFVTNNGVRITNSALVTLNADWTNEGECTIINNGTIRTTGSFINLGHLDQNSTGRFVLQYAADRNFQPGGYAIGSLVKSGQGAALLTGSIHIRDSLLLRTGLLQLVNAFDTVFVRSGGMVEADTGSYVTGGFVARAGTGDMIFPLGKDGLYLPLKIYKVHAQRVTTSIRDAPPTHTAGPGVESLIGFPYAWQVTESTPEDTAAYVELNYPNTLPSAPDLVVAREIPGSQYASMGARYIEESLYRITVKSYSRRLDGLFTVAQGSASDIVTDSLALVSLYQSTGGTGWTNRTNWLTGTLETWYGITLNGQSITDVNLSNNGLSGPVTDPLADIVTLQNVDLSGNTISTIPDFTDNPGIISLNVSDNHLDFSSLEPNASVTGFLYLAQAEIGPAIDTVVQAGTVFAFRASAGGQNGQYKWKQNGEVVSDSLSDGDYLATILRNTMGEYRAEVTNASLPGLALTSKIQKVLAHADVSGTLLVDSSVAAEQGEVTLYKIQSGGFEPVASVSIEPGGAYRFENVILDDYQLRGFADTVLYHGVLPTYYKSSIFWEFADSLALEGNTGALNILSQFKPGALSGTGSISGYLEESESGGRAKENHRIADAGVSLHSIEQTGTKEVLTLAAYSFTNEEGEFTFSNLPEGEYRLNFQYPGFPMDETSFTTISIGADDDSQVLVEASVADGKISVSKLSITGLFQPEEYTAEVYPNPAANVILLSFPAEVRRRTITFLDMGGKVIYSNTAPGKVLSVDVNNFQKGMYILQVNENGVRKKTFKISFE